MIVCDEMKKLREMLDKKGIKWMDYSDELIEEKGYFMCRTRFLFNDKYWSVINGFGSYGGVDFETGINDGLLEVYSVGMETIGFLTAKEVMAIINWNRNGDEE